MGVKGAYVLLLVTSISTIVGGVGAGDFLAIYESHWLFRKADR
jgi:hypothetical protein